MKKFVLTVFCASALFAQPPAIDWGKQRAEILKYYRDLVQIDTSPPGNETKAVEYLKIVLGDEGRLVGARSLEGPRKNEE